MLTVVVEANNFEMTQQDAPLQDQYWIHDAPKISLVADEMSVPSCEFDDTATHRCIIKVKGLKSLRRLPQSSKLTLGISFHILCFETSNNARTMDRNGKSDEA
jgi:hypothetical protein